MGNVVACVNEAFLTHLLHNTATTFTGSRVVANTVEVAYHAEDLPHFALAKSNDTEEDFQIVVPALQISAFRYTEGERRGKIGQSKFELRFYGTFHFHRGEADHGRIYIRILRGEVTGGNRVGRAVLSMYIDNAVIPAISSRLPEIAMPDMQDLLGFAVQVERLHTANHLLYMVMTVAGSSQAQTTPTPITTQTEAPSIFIAATDDAISTTQRTFSLKRGIDEDTNFPLPMGLKLGIASLHLVGYVQARRLHIRIDRGDPSCKVDLTASAGLKMGLKPLGKLDLSLKPTITPPRFSLHLQIRADNRQLTTAIQMESSPLVSWAIPGLPRVFRPLVGELLGWIDTSMTVVYDAIDTSLRVIKIPVISLDRLPMPAHFQSVRFEGNSIVAQIVLDQEDDE
jgi:hypothetical protein